MPLPPPNSQITPGGSLANSLVAYSMLNDALLRCMPLAFTPAPVPTPSTPPAVAIAGPLGSDAMGQYFTQQMRSHGVHVLSEPPQHSSTGTVAVLTTPDAQRSFMSYLGSDEPLASHAPALQQHLPQTELLLIEGYLWEAVDGMQAIRNAAMEARAAGTRVALTCGDAGIVTRHASAIVSLLQEGLVDVLFANKQEALALLECGGVSDVCQVSGRIRSVPADACATALCTHLCPLVLVTDGANGAAIAQRAEHSHVPELHIVPPCWQKDPPADTNGAGDAFAGAFLFGWLGGIGVRRAGRLAARAAGAVITRPGAALTQHEAKRVVLESFGLCVLETDDRQLAAAAGGEAALGLGW